MLCGVGLMQVLSEAGKLVAWKQFNIGYTTYHQGITHVGCAHGSGESCHT